MEIVRIFKEVYIHADAWLRQDTTQNTLPIGQQMEQQMTVHNVCAGQMNARVAHVDLLQDNLVAAARKPLEGRPISRVGFSKHPTGDIPTNGPGARICVQGTSQEKTRSTAWLEYC